PGADHPHAIDGALAGVVKRPVKRAKPSSNPAERSRRVQGEISTFAAPAAIGPYVQARAEAGWLFCSGQIGLDPDRRTLVTGGIRSETVRALRNLEAVLSAAGAGLEDVVRTTLYLVDMADFAEVNEIYSEVFRAPFPARTTVTVAALPKSARVEI